MVLTPPPIVIGGDKKADAEMEQAPPWLVEGWSGRQLPGCLVGVRACVSASALMGMCGVWVLRSWPLS